MNASIKFTGPAAYVERDMQEIDTKLIALCDMELL